MIVYYYTRIEDWDKIKKGSFEGGNKSGIEPSKRLRTDSNKTGTSALLRYLPQSWIDNVDFPNTWKNFRDNEKSLLLEIEVDPEKIKIYDRGYLESLKKTQQKFH